ncbi:hypothetical protein [Halioxenophilus sp. WMMB6]|uniref:hypothetical protein n=1 Tax=Halioxenophilus sp. WMMB6 TaxID=3073815 RepID=UPI00295E45AA|nr:hypothetical protein [Halioxenophilus sp. WMMB6]
MTNFTEENRPHVIRDAKGKRPGFYRTEGVDELLSMVMVMAGEISVLRDRLDAHERVAKHNGLDMASAIEQLELDEEALQAREAVRQDFLERLFYLARKEANEAATNQTDSSFNKTIEEIAEK